MGDDAEARRFLQLAEGEEVLAVLYGLAVGGAGAALALAHGGHFLRLEHAAHGAGHAGVTSQLVQRLEGGEQGVIVLRVLGLQGAGDGAVAVLDQQCVHGAADRGAFQGFLRRLGVAGLQLGFQLVYGPVVPVEDFVQRGAHGRQDGHFRGVHSGLFGADRVGDVEVAQQDAAGFEAHRQRLGHAGDRVFVGRV